MPKNDNFVIKFFVLLSALLICPSLFAGGISGGGGKGVLCQNQLQALDVYEMNLRKQQAHLPYEEFDKNLVHFLKRTYEYINRPDGSTEKFSFDDFFKLYSEGISEIKNKIVDISSSKRLPLTKDATLPKLSNLCKEVQVIIMGNDGKIYRDLRYWNLLDDLDKIAFIIHEFMYFKAKSAGAVDSDEARRTVGEILSNRPLDPVFPKELINAPKTWCGVGGASNQQEVHEFYLVEEQRNKKDGIAIYFFSIGNKAVISRTSSYIEMAVWNNFINNSKGKITVPIINQFTNTQLLLEIKNSNQTLSFRVKRSIQDESKDFSNSFCRHEQ